MLRVRAFSSSASAWMSQCLKDDLATLHFNIYKGDFSSLWDKETGKTAYVCLYPH